MVRYNKNILRVIVIASYVIIITLIIYGISALLAYLNTGADRSTILHTEIQKIDQYLPKVTWAPLSNEGRPIDSENLNKIENNYLDAWYVKHIAYKTNTTAGIKDYYTDSARLNLFNFIELNAAQNISIESTTLEHHPSLEFFSEDGQLAVITDKDVIEYKRIFQNELLVLETTEISTYKIILLLEDGFWRIRHLVKESTESYDPIATAISTKNLNIQGINYYPQATPWDMFGEAFSADIITKDFKTIKDAGLNSVRIFIPYEDFGKADVDAEKLEKLKHTLDAAQANHLGVVVTLFDFYGDYSILDWTLNMRHAETIVTALKDHKAIVAWDIKNEPNLDFESRGKDMVVAWLKNMVQLVKSKDQNHPVTIGWSNTESASILKDKVDFVSFHYYEDLELLQDAIKTMKVEIPNKTIVLGEFGMSSYNGFWKPFGNSDEDQANYHKKAQEIIATNNLQYMSWTLYDFENIPKDVVGKLPWRKDAQKQFGFIDKNGAKKLAFKYISGQ
ncbi:glycoside hydrolase family 2 TIM barrel-domain containing protein [uncultured Psychroserpens sp.]|uniref:glycoside hydrolase family 2 TIM barrel-domain containing protein n=1 Tax=uncultured Psychroserpens sp. TaxID=255436 RepID=UPI00260A4585|nr:glycoside hydrolase family 2 TIM barrel-domain containing protein [uncultured Psychroserpens sp.]